MPTYNSSIPAVMKHSALQIAVLFLSLAFLAACGSEEKGPDVSFSNTVISIAARSTATRADLSEGPVEENELIISWWIAMVDKSGKVAAILSDTPSAPCSEDEVEGLLPAGDYIAYAFANISQEDVKKSTDPQLEFTVGETAPTLDAIKSIRWKNLTNNHTGNIPMCGYKEIKVRGAVTEKFSIEVVRMLAKVEFSFGNKSGKKISVKSISFAPLNAGDVVMMPDYSTLAFPDAEGSKPTLGVDTESITYALENFTIAAGTDNGGRTHFYVKEAVADSHPTGHFNFSLKIEREGKVEEQLYALTDHLAFINRNDYILIPVDFREYSFEPEVRFYPPIGGYPPVIIENRMDEYYITFGTQGYFEITTHVYDNSSDGKIALPRSKYNVTVSVSEPDGTSIFTKKPSLDSTTGEIIGELSSSVGTAKVQIEVKVTESGNSVTFTRNIYIIRQ